MERDLDGVGVCVVVVQVDPEAGDSSAPALTLPLVCLVMTATVGTP